MTAPALSDIDVLREWRRMRLSCTSQDALTRPAIRRVLEVTAHAYAKRKANLAARQPFDFKRLQAGDID